MVRRGEVWLAKLDPTVGSEIQKTRPCLVVSPEEMNETLRTLAALPMSTGSRPAPFRIAVRFKNKDGFILADQLRTLDKRRLISRLGTVEDHTISSVLSVLRSTFED